MWLIHYSPRNWVFKGNLKYLGKFPPPPPPSSHSSLLWSCLVEKCCLVSLAAIKNGTLSNSKRLKYFRFLFQKNNKKTKYVVKCVHCIFINLIRGNAIYISVLTFQGTECVKRWKIIILHLAIVLGLLYLK